MSRNMLLIFNHRITRLQEEDARNSLGVERIVGLPADLQALWSRVPPNVPAIDEYLGPVKEWLEGRAAEGDYILIQGDFGACYLMVGFAFEKGLVPIYSTTEREAIEEYAEDGSVNTFHRFEHRMFRIYGR